MKVYAHYDLVGTIRSLVTVEGPQQAGMMLVPKPGVFVAEIEGLKLKSGKADPEALREIVGTHKVSTPLPHCTLVKKG